MEEQMIPEISQASQERIGKFKYICENCGYKGDHYKYIFLDSFVMFTVLKSISGVKLLRTCPQCNKRSIKIDPLDNVLIPGSFGIKKQWTIRSIIVLIFVVVFVLIILPTLASIYLK